MARTRKPSTRNNDTLGQLDSVELAKVCARIAEDKKAEEIVLLDLTHVTYVTDYFLIATGINSRQMHAISVAIQEELSGRGVKPVGVEGADESRWVLLDYGDFVVHLFDPEWRKLYDLELLWGDVPRLDWHETTKKPARAPRTTTRKPRKAK